MSGIGPGLDVRLRLRLRLRIRLRQGGPLGTRFFSLRTAPKDRQPPTANRLRRPTANRQPLPTDTNRQPPTANRHQPPITNQQPPTTNRHQSPTANRQPPSTMVEHMSYTRSFCKTAVQEHFFFLLRTPLASGLRSVSRPKPRLKPQPGPTGPSPSAY